MEGTVRITAHPQTAFFPEIPAWCGNGCVTCRGRGVPGGCFFSSQHWANEVLWRFFTGDRLMDPNTRVSLWLSVPFVIVLLSAAALGWKPLLQVWLMLCCLGF